VEDWYLGIHDDPFAQYNYYGSQVYVNVPAASPGPSSAQFVHRYVHPSEPSTSTSASTSASFTTTCNQIESSQAEDSMADESRKRGKGPKKQAAKYGVNFHVIDTCG